MRPAVRLPITPEVNPTRSRLAALALAVAIVPVATSPADAAVKHRRHKQPKHVAAATVAPARPVAAPAPAAAPVSSVISIGGYVFYNLSYAEAVAAYQAAVASAPAGYTPPPVTSISVTTTVGGSVQ